MQVMLDVIDILNTLSENQLIYVYTFLHKLFGIKNKG